MSWRDDIKEYFKDVDFVIQATYEEKHMLWLTRHHHDVQLGHIHIWDDEGAGRCPTIAMVGRGRKARPIVISIFYAYLDGLRVAFYEPTSQLVDWLLIDKWIKERTGHIKYNNGTRWAHTDVGNFHDVIHEIQNREDKRQRRLR